MDNLVYTVYTNYFKNLEATGTSSKSNVFKTLLLGFYRELLDSPHVQISEEDYGAIHRALGCLYGSSCLIPYPDYLKEKGKCKESSDITHRLKVLTTTRRLKLFDYTYQ